jgi:hypothetical protein
MDDTEATKIKGKYLDIVHSDDESNGRLNELNCQSIVLTAIKCALQQRIN